MLLIIIIIIVQLFSKIYWNFFPSLILALKFFYTSSLVMTSMARSLPVENLLPLNVGSIIEYLQNATEVAKCGALSCSRPQPATDNGVRDGRSNWQVVTLTLYKAVPFELRVLHYANGGHKSQDLLQPLGREHAAIGMPGIPATECQAATQAAFSIFTRIFSPSSSVSISYIILAFPIRKCFGKHSAWVPHFL